MTTGIIIGRFQVPELTLGHKSLLFRAYDYFDQVGVLIGCSGVQNDGNPLTFDMRVPLFEGWDLAFIAPLMDVPGDNQAWSKRVDLAVDNVALGHRLGRITLVGGRQSFIPSYSGRYPTQEVDIWRGRSGTEVRNSVDIEDSVGFRRGVIWQVLHGGKAGL